jgi:sulfhydrogenase subunit beta (sulfur reductase)
MRVGDRALIGTSGLEQLIQALWTGGYEVIGPRSRDGAIVYDTLRSAAELPAGVADEQEAGRYRLARHQSGLRFGYAVGPHSWKRFLHPPLLTLWRARRTEAGFELEHDRSQAPRQAFVGVRACELAAIALQDRVLLGDARADPAYRARRERAFLFAVNCSDPAATCFCDSLGTGPRVNGGFDLLLTELTGGDEARLLLEVGSEAGAQIAASIDSRPAGQPELEQASAVSERARARIGRALRLAGLRERLAERLDDTHWDEVARRCLSCGNCTLVCPSCFCTTVEDVTDLAGARAERRRRWDSCFTLDFSYIHGGSVRTSGGARYRQWLTHKLGTWQDQFGTPGCVGCGRCITWCPAAIDITAEAGRLATDERAIEEVTR